MERMIEKWRGGKQKRKKIKISIMAPRVKMEEDYDGDFGNELI